jgi:spore coat protein X
LSLFGDVQTTNRWSALSGCDHPMADPTVTQAADQVSVTSQTNDETIIVKDSCEVTVHTTSTEVAVSIQLAIQLAIAVVLEISVGDSIDRDEVLQDLLQFTQIRQSNKQKTVIENSRNVKVTTTDTDVAVTAQVALQILVAILVVVDIL